LFLLEEFKDRAKRNPKAIVFPEGEDERILKAAVKAAREGIAFPYLLGDKDKIALKAKDLNLLDNLNLREILTGLAENTKSKKPLLGITVKPG